MNDRVDRGFERLGGEIRELRGEFNDLRGEMKIGFEGIHRMMFQAAVVFSAALIGLIAAIATKL